jgi:hypothetical protein
MTDFAAIQREMLVLLHDRLAPASWKPARNPDRRWWQLWKPKFVQRVTFPDAAGPTPPLKIRMPERFPANG